MDEADEIADLGSLQTANSVNGVPDIDVSITVLIDVIHDDITTLSATLVHPDGTTIEIWEVGSYAPDVVELEGTFTGLGVNDHWQLIITDHEQDGMYTELWGWALEIEQAY